MVKQISFVTSHGGNRCKTLSTQNTCLVNIILLVAEIIPDNWCYFSFWHQVFVLTILSCLLLIFQCCYQPLTPCAGVCSASAHWLTTNVIGGSQWSLHAQCVSGTLEIRWVHFPPTSQALRCDYCAHVHRNDNAQTIYCSSSVGWHYSEVTHQLCYTLVLNVVSLVWSSCLLSDCQLVSVSVEVFWTPPTCLPGCWDQPPCLQSRHQVGCPPAGVRHYTHSSSYPPPQHVFITLASLYSVWC